MKFSRLFSALLVAAAALACVVLPALAAKPKTGYWAGPTKTTSTAKSVDFNVIKGSKKSRRVKAFRLHDISVSCTPNGTFTQTQTVPAQSFNKPVKVKKNGRFKLTDTAGVQTTKVTGRFKSKRKASGTVVFTHKTASKECTTGKLKWSAKLK